MKQYKVIAGACPYMVKNTVLDAGQIVDADFFLEGDAERLVKEMFIEEVPESEEAKEAKPKEAKNK